MVIHRSRLMPPTFHGALVVAAGVISAALLAGCWDSDPCDPGQIVFMNACVTPLPPAPAAGSSTGTGPATGTGGATGTGTGPATGTGGATG
ncbi:MAG TPA: hypothetical protein VL242_14585, partial [Sorangium sp.]|nr:hypothetical protein [Sorangium sp.]